MFIAGMIVGSVLTVVGSCGYLFIQKSTEKDELLATSIGKKFEDGLRLIGVAKKPTKKEDKD